AGDVIRTTPLLRRIRKEHPRAWISWMTETPEVVPTRTNDPMGADEVLRWNTDGQWIALGTPWDWLIALDKDRPLLAMAARCQAKQRSGFALENGRAAGLDAAAHAKFLTGIDDQLNRANTLSYPQEIFRICGYDFAGEEYVLDPCLDQPLPERIPQGKQLVGLNTGCAPRWKTRLWPEQHWKELAWQLRDAGYGVLLLGGPAEHEKNERIAGASGAAYLGHFPLRQFIRLIGEIDVMVTAVTMAMHLAIGLHKRLVLFNNIFNPREFELYGRGEILEPDPPCECTFVSECDKLCMDRIAPGRVLDAVKRQAVPSK
ncbi:MAG: glycosyltransferase family 9 protein, partial [bacterium]|nr:glycosyltransferase family 9 protein [bacterium]